jgi:diaminopimelate decarboxylase
LAIPIIHGVKGALLIEGLSLSELAQKYGTPLFIVSKRQLIENYKHVISEFRAEGLYPKVFYSVKTNHNLAICQIMQTLGCGAEVVSLRELAIAKYCKFNPNRIIYNSPCKKPTDIKTVIESGVGLINCDSFDEINLINRLAYDSGVVQKVGIRIDPMADRKNKFGVSPCEAIEIASATITLKNIKLVALHFHIGTRITNTEMYYKSISTVAHLRRNINNIIRWKISCIDIGGGYPSFWDLAQMGLKYRSYVRAIKQAIPREKNNSINLFIEPGRCIVGDAVMCVAQVVAVKKLKGISWAILDVGINALPALKKATYEFIAVPIDTIGKKRLSCRLAGPLCMGNDTFAGQNRLNLASGDLVVVLNAGAYTLSLWNEFCVSFPRVILIDGNKHKDIGVYRQHNNKEDS